MPLDPDVKAALDRRAAAGGPAQYEIPPAELRARQEALQRKPGPEIAAVSDHFVPGPHGDVPVRVYVPITDDAGPLPVCMWFHGGGWIYGSIDSNDANCRELANRAGVIMVSVDYRLSPDHKFPVPFDDSYAATA